MTFVKWGIAAALALAIAPAYGDDNTQTQVTQAQQDAQKQKADAQADAAKQKADAQQKMADADRDAREKSAKADQKAQEKISSARQDEAKQGRDVRASSDAAAGTSGDKNKAPLSADAKKALQMLHSDSQAEVGMARIAQDKAQNDKVKDLAKTIQDDHQKLVDKTSEMARDHNVDLAVHGDMAKNQQHVEQLQKLSGASFDQHYAQMMAQEHRKDIAELRKLQPKLRANKADHDVSKLVDSVVGKMQEHEKLAIDAQTALRKDERQGRRGGTSWNDSSRTSPSTTNGMNSHTDADTSSGADTATGPHTGADSPDTSHSSGSSTSSGDRR